jgi:hypothetical protein
MSNTAAATTQRGKRMFPSYTLAELIERLPNASPENQPIMAKEIADRQSGVSIHVPTPQVSWSDVKIPFI